MKKTKTILILLTLFALCLSLCGCNALDNLRQSRASLTEDGAIRFQDGTEYKLLPECEEFYPDFEDSETVHVAEEDVPLLLLSILGSSAEKSKDGRFVKAYLRNASGIYCRSDLYEELSKRIEQGFTPEVYCYSYYDPQAGDYGGYRLYELTSGQIRAVNQVYTTQEPEKLPAVARLDYNYRADLYMYTADHLFRKDMMDVCVMNGEYFLVTNDNSIYTVPEELFPIFERIMQKATGK